MGNIRKKSNYLIFLKRLRSALLSGNQIAYFAIFIKFLAPFCRFLDYIFSLFIKKKINEVPTCFIIIGPSRSGSTIIYQVLTRAIRSTFFSNLHALFPTTASNILSNKCFTRKGSKKGLKNYYGYTSSFRDVYEGNEFIKNIFKNGTSEIRDRFLDIASKLNASHEKPMILKNILIRDYITELHHTVPEIKFIRIKRDYNQLIQSTLKAYKELGYFYYQPSTIDTSEIEDPIELAVLNVLEVEKLLDEKFKNIDKSNVLIWSYEQFCKDPWSFIFGLSEEHLGIKKNKINKNIFDFFALKKSNRKKVTIEEQEKIEYYLSKYKNKLNM